jgi:archaellum component FlaF (FlaF/FlaG flagellin family)
MSLEKINKINAIEIFKNGVVNVKKTISILENNKVISENTSNYFINPGDDYSKESEKIKEICAIAHTNEVISLYEETQKQKMQQMTNN